jgi:hypothetical protein
VAAKNVNARTLNRQARIREARKHRCEYRHFPRSSTKRKLRRHKVTSWLILSASSWIRRFSMTRGFHAGAGEAPRESLTGHVATPIGNMRVAFSRHARMIFRLDPELENPGAVPWEFAGIVQRVRSPSS